MEEVAGNGASGAEPIFQIRSSQMQPYAGSSASVSPRGKPGASAQHRMLRIRNVHPLKSHSSKISTLSCRSEVNIRVRTIKKNRA